MGRTARDKRDLPHPKPVQKIQLSEENTIRRLIAAGLFLVLGAGALAYAFSCLMAPDTGWQTIQASSSEGATCGDEFAFFYELGSSGVSPAVENRAVTSLYSQACRTAFQLFHTEESFEGMMNLREINSRPNEVLEVDDLLYRAFAEIQASGSRAIYLGPVYARYSDLFYCEDDTQLIDFDPRLSEAVAEEYAAVAAYAADPQAIDVELLGDSQICLRVSEDYLAYAQREGIDHFLDFGWMTNAFIVDYLAETMAESGYTNGSITSHDGYARCLDSREGSYSLNLYDWTGGEVYFVGTMEYQGPMSLVNLRAFPIGEAEWLRFYQLRSGEYRTLYLDVQDGLCKSTVSSLVCYSNARGCAQLALEMAPVFIADVFESGRLDQLAEKGVYAAYCRNWVLYGTDPELTVSGLYQEDGVGYTLSLP